MIDAALAASGAFIIRAATVGRDTGIATTAFRSWFFAACIRPIGNGAACVIAAAFGAAALIVVWPAALVLRFAEDEWVVATQLFAVADAITTGVVTTLAMRSAEPSRIAAIGTAFLGTWRGRGDADALPALGSLLTRTGRRFGRGGGTPGCFGAVVPEGAADSGRATQAEQAFEERTPTRAGSQRLGKRIKTTIVHSRTSFALSVRS